MVKRIIVLVLVLLVLIGGFLLTKTILQNKETSSNPNIVISLKPGQTITSPLQISGKARGFWFFEASFPIKLIDENNNVLATGIAQTEENWMTEDFVDFTAELKFISEKGGKGFLILSRDNPSGLPENDEELKIPVTIEPMEILTIKVFFNNNQMDPEASCNKVFPAERTIKKIEAVGRAAIEELLKGPNESERAQGFFTSINPGVKIQSLTIENTIAKIDFNEQLQFQVGGSCRVSAIRAEITETLKQFESVKSVIISIDGRTEDILQP